MTVIGAGECASQTLALAGLCSLSPTGKLDFGEGFTVGEEGRGEGAEGPCSSLAPSPPLSPRW